MADLTPYLQVYLLWVLIAESFHSLQSLSVSCFHVILGLPGPGFPSTCMSKVVLTAPLEHSTCPYQQSLLSFRMRASSSSSSFDPIVTLSCGLTLQICLIIALSFRCRRWRFGFVNGQVSLSCSAHELYPWPCILKERWREKRTGSSSLDFYQAVFTCHQLLRVYLLDSKRKLPPPSCQVWLGLPSVVCLPRGVQFPVTVYMCNQGPMSSAWASCISCAPSACSHCRRCCCCPLHCDSQCTETHPYMLYLTEIKSHRIWPIWKAVPIKNSNLTEFSDHFTTDFIKKLT